MRRLLVSIIVMLSVVGPVRAEGRNLRGPQQAAVRQAVPPAPQRPAQATQPTRDRARTPTGTAVIRGHVYAADTGAPLRRARVNWSSDLAAANTVGAALRVMTDNEGRYEIRDLPAGRYRVFAKRSGYLQMDLGARRAGSDVRTAPTAAERGIAIDLADGQVFDNADFHLPRAGVITGRILDDFGEPLVSAMVMASRQMTSNGRRRLITVASDTTDDLGEYRLSGLPAGSYYVVAATPGYLRFGGTSSYADLFYPGVAVRDQARPVTIREGQEASDISFMLSPIRLARISGTVVTSRGIVPRIATITMTQATDVGMTRASVYMSALNAEGNFTISSVAPGDCDVVITAQLDGGNTEVGAVRLSITGDDISGLTIATGAEGQIVGTVRTDNGAPLPGPTSTTSISAQFATAITMPVRVVANAVDTGNDGILGGLATGSTTNRAGSVGANGSFAAPVRPGARVLGVGGLPSGWALVSVMSGERNLTDVPVDVAPGTTLNVQMVVSNRLPEIAGSVVDAENKRTWDYDVVVFPRDPTRWLPGSTLIRTERPNQRGDFRLAGLRPGDYYVAAVQPGEETDWTDRETLERIRAGSAEVTVALGEKKTVQLRMVGSR